MWCRLGGFPEGLLGLAIEQAQSITATNATLEGMEQSCENSFSLYRRTKPPASTESVKRARKFPRGGPHALLHELAVRLKIEQPSGAAADGGEGAARADITNALKRFRPVATVLEAQVRTGNVCVTRERFPRDPVCVVMHGAALYSLLAVCQTVVWCSGGRRQVWPCEHDACCSQQSRRHDSQARRAPANDCRTPQPPRPQLHSCR